MRTATEWRCPRCGRGFLHREARHACVRGTVEDFFRGHPGPLALFGPVDAALQALGHVEREITRSEIGYRAARRFAWVWMPQTWIARAPAGALVLTFELDRRPDSARIKQVVETHPGHWTHHLVLEDASQLDDEVKGWLHAAHALAAVPGQSGRVARKTRERGSPS